MELQNQNRKEKIIKEYKKYPQSWRTYVFGLKGPLWAQKITGVSGRKGLQYSASAATFRKPEVKERSEKFPERKNRLHKKD